MAKGVSTLLGTILLIGIALAAGGAIFNIANQYAIVGFTKTEYSILGASLTKSNGGCLLRIELANMGTEQIVNTMLEISTDSIDALPPSLVLKPKDPEPVISKEEILPGQYSPIVKIDHMGKNVDPGDSVLYENFFSPCAWNSCQPYTMDVLGEARDSSSSVSHIVQCRESEGI